MIQAFYWHFWSLTVKTLLDNLSDLKQNQIKRQKNNFFPHKSKGTSLGSESFIDPENWWDCSSIPLSLIFILAAYNLILVISWHVDYMASVYIQANSSIVVVVFLSMNENKELWCGMGKPRLFLLIRTAKFIYIFLMAIGKLVIKLGCEDEAQIYWWKTGRWDLHCITCQSYRMPLIQTIQDDLLHKTTFGVLNSKNISTICKHMAPLTVLLYVRRKGNSKATTC